MPYFKKRSRLRILAGIGATALSLTLLAVPTAAEPASLVGEQVVNLASRRAPSVGTYIPPRRGSGDADFAGHGPKVDLIADLLIGFAEGTTHKTNLQVWIRMHAMETRSDWTEAGRPEGDFDPGSPNTIAYRIYDAPPGFCIIGVNRHRGDRHTYTDTDHSLDVFGGQLLNTFVQKWEIMGDTNGNEAGTKTGAVLFTQPMQVTIAPC